MDFFQHKKPLIVCSFILLISACSLFGSEGDKIANRTGVFEGIFKQGIEDSWFTPCKYSDETWNLLFTEETYAPLREEANERWAPKRIVVKGRPSEKGEYTGFFALYDREFDLEDLVIKESDTEEC